MSFDQATPEQKARAGIDDLLRAAGWVVCGVTEANISAHLGVAVREFPLLGGRTDSISTHGRR